MVKKKESKKRGGPPLKPPLKGDPPKMLWPYRHNDHIRDMVMVIVVIDAIIDMGVNKSVCTSALRALKLIFLKSVFKGE